MWSRCYSYNLEFFPACESLKCLIMDVTWIWTIYSNSIRLWNWNNLLMVQFQIFLPFNYIIQLRTNPVWLKSCFSSFKSQPSFSTAAVPQGSILGPYSSVYFLLAIFSVTSISYFHCYANNVSYLYLFGICPLCSSMLPNPLRQFWTVFSIISDGVFIFTFPSG